jgi:predicted metal-dependent enzyme (double-stranded beta helix superfamily)
MMTDILLPPGRTHALDRLAKLQPELAIQRALLFVARLSEEWIGSPVTSLLAPSSADGENGPQIVQQFQGQTKGWWLGLFLWPPGAATPIHDHTSWGVYSCAAGTLLEERYRRLDDGTQPNHAHLRLAWRRRWGRGDCTQLMPYDGGIHRVTNPGDKPAWSVHLYGPRQGVIDGRDYDPTHDYVCDRAA